MVYKGLFPLFWLSTLVTALTCSKKQLNSTTGKSYTTCIPIQWMTLNSSYPLIPLGDFYLSYIQTSEQCPVQWFNHFWVNQAILSSKEIVKESNSKLLCMKRTLFQDHFISGAIPLLFPKSTWAYGFYKGIECGNHIQNEMDSDVMTLIPRNVDYHRSCHLDEWSQSFNSLAS